MIQVDSLGEEIFSDVISAYFSSKESFSTQPCPSFRNCMVTLHFALHYAAERGRVNKDVRVVTWQKVKKSREIFFMIVFDNLSKFKDGIRKKLR